MKNNRIFFRYLAFAIEALLLCVIQGTPKLIPEIFGSKPLLLVPMALCIAAFENEIPSLIFGAVCGVLTDISSGYIGYFAILLTIVCFFESYIFKHYLVSKFLPVMVISFVAVSILIFIYFVITFVISNVENSWVYFVNHYISRIVYTYIMVIPLFFLNKYLTKNLK